MLYYLIKVSILKPFQYLSFILFALLISHCAYSHTISMLCLIFDLLKSITYISYLSIFYVHLEFYHSLYKIQVMPDSRCPVIRKHHSSECMGYLGGVSGSILGKGYKKGSHRKVMGTVTIN